MTPSTYHPDWWRLAMLPAIAFLLSLALFSVFDLDLRVAEMLFQADQTFPFEQSDRYEYWLHWLPKKLAAAVFFLIVIAALLPHRSRRFQNWNLPLWLAIGAMLSATSIIGTLKRKTGIYCPVQIEHFGGTAQESYFGPWPVFLNEAGACWPAGHATTGLAFMALYFSAMMMTKPKLARLLLIVSLACGQLLGLAQVIRGYHFLSHQIWSTAICWFTSLMWFWLWHTLAKRQQIHTAIVTTKVDIGDSAS